MLLQATRTGRQLANKPWWLLLQSGHCFASSELTGSAVRGRSQQTPMKVHVYKHAPARRRTPPPCPLLPHNTTAVRPKPSSRLFRRGADQPIRPHPNQPTPAATTPHSTSPVRHFLPSPRQPHTGHGTGRDTVPKNQPKPPTQTLPTRRERAVPSRLRLPFPSDAFSLPGPGRRIEPKRGPHHATLPPSPGLKPPSSSSEPRSKAPPAQKAANTQKNKKTKAMLAAAAKASIVPPPRRRL